MNQSKGVVKISPERWQKAQICEKNHWFVRGIKRGNDRNDYHFKQFNNYENIKTQNFDSILEIGCGPFTNARIIASVYKIKNCTLLDPLVLDYIKHPFCSYNEKYLYSEYFPIIGKIIRKIFPFSFKLYQSIFCRKIRIKKLLNISGENITKNELYDLVIMINVVEHCFDIELIFQNILNVIKKDSYFIFEDKLFDNKEIKKSLEFSYDAAHPLKVGKNVIYKFLDDNFDVVYKRVQTNSNFFGGEHHLSDDIYFIGKRK